MALLTNAYANPLPGAYTELLAEFADVSMPSFRVPADPTPVDITPWAGTYRNNTREATVESRDGEPWVRMRYCSEISDGASVDDIQLTPIDATLFADRLDVYPRSWTFRRLPSGAPYLYLGGRLLPQVDAPGR